MNFKTFVSTFVFLSLFGALLYTKDALLPDSDESSGETNQAPLRFRQSSSQVPPEFHSRSAQASLRFRSGSAQVPPRFCSGSAQIPPESSANC